MNNIKTYRQKLNMTIRNLSTVSGIAIGYLSNLENDYEDLTNPTKTTMVKISQALQASVTEVFFANDFKKKGEGKSESL